MGGTTFHSTCSRRSPRSQHAPHRPQAPDRAVRLCTLRLWNVFWLVLRDGPVARAARLHFDMLRSCGESHVLWSTLHAVFWLLFGQRSAPRAQTTLEDPTSASCRILPLTASAIRKTGATTRAAAFAFFVSAMQV